MTSADYTLRSDLSVLRDLLRRLEVAQQGILVLARRWNIIHQNKKRIRNTPLYRIYLIKNYKL
jgi:hypothetical protein